VAAQLVIVYTVVVYRTYVVESSLVIDKGTMVLLEVVLAELLLVVLDVAPDALTGQTVV
jgi:hypothetical protein